MARSLSTGMIRIVEAFEGEKRPSPPLPVKEKDRGERNSG